MLERNLGTSADRFSSPLDLAPIQGKTGDRRSLVFRLGRPLLQDPGKDQLVRQPIARLVPVSVEG